MTAVTSLYTAATGLQALGQGMSVVGTNLANVSTTGYKRETIHFSDVISDTVVTGGGTAQVGKGVQLSDLITDFNPGTFAPATESTDLAIGGNGFFVVSPQGSEDRFYTRSGAFRFDKDGYLKEPGGGIVQGYAVATHKDPSVVTANGDRASELEESIDFTAMTDVRLNAGGEASGFVSPPERTTRMEMVVNLDSQATNKASEPPAGTSPAFALFSEWNAGNADPLDPAQYSYTSPLTIYDQSGEAHTVNAYFDPVYTPGQGDEFAGSMVWEYVLTTDPAADARAVAQGSSKAGMLMTGTMTFNASGELVNQSAFTPGEGADLADLSNWKAASMSDNGYFLFSPQFEGEEGDFGSMEVNFGITDRSPQVPDPDLSAADIPDLDAAAAVRMLNMVNDSSRFASSSTSFDSGSATLRQDQDGYPEGSLMSISVDRDGVLTGEYSNGQIRSLFALAVADCTNRFELHREGGNLFSETPGCGGMQFGLAGTGNARFDVGGEALEGLGGIASESLEQSNVDMATEFVEMILTQKGFQANGKVVTTSDEILKMLNQMKR
jgi:flagellar hook protein FlgE